VTELCCHKRMSAHIGSDLHFYIFGKDQLAENCLQTWGVCANVNFFKDMQP
jgi:hypothetical protein